MTIWLQIVCKRDKLSQFIIDFLKLSRISQEIIKNKREMQPLGCNFYKMAQNGFILLKCAIFIKSKVSTLLCHFERKWATFITRKVALNAHFLKWALFSQNKEIEDFYKMKTCIFILNKREKCMKSKISSRIEDSWHFMKRLHRSLLSLSMNRRFITLRHLLGAHEIIKISWKRDKNEDIWLHFIEFREKFIVFMTIWLQIVKKIDNFLINCLKIKKSLISMGI